MGITFTCLDCGPECNLSPDTNLGEEIRNILCPGRDAQLLKMEMDSLKAIKADVQDEINRRKRGDPCLEMTEVVRNWRNAVDEHHTKVEEILVRLKNGNNGSCGCFCARPSLGYDVRTELEVVRRLKSERENWRDDNLVQNISSSRFTHNDVLPERLQCSKIIVGIEETMSKVLKCLKDDEVGVIGIHGMGGAGKTTLINQVVSRLRSLSSSLLEEEKPIIKFDSIISVVVSQNPDIGKIQMDMAEKLGLSEHEKFRNIENGTTADRAKLLYAGLSKEKFLLVLDDVWERVDLWSIGIPSPNGNKSKVILTTRDVKVCANMGANMKSTVRVGCLREEDSWELFKKTIGWDNVESELIDIHNIAKEMIAKEMVRKCGGLPLVLTTIARAMLFKETVGEWTSAEETLKNFPHEIHGMDHVFGLLKFSYDNLKEDKHRYCLRYSALFREDEEISIREMVDYCIGGGVVDGGGGSSSSSASDINRLRTKGKNIVSELIHACLLERGKDEDHVKVHDATRDMILTWLGKSDDREQKILSYAGKGLQEVKIDEKLLRDASMVSLRSNDILEVLVVDRENLVRECNNNMGVLLLNWNTRLRNLPSSFFEYFPNICVLDLSWTGLTEIPASLCSLKSLRYLNLSGTSVSALPKEMGNLTNIMQLDLTHTYRLREIPSGVFSSLSKLQSMKLLDCNLGDYGDEQKLLKEVDGLPLLKDVGLSFNKSPNAVKFLVDESNMLSKSITELKIIFVDLISHGLFQKIGSRCKKLEHLSISHFLNCKKEDLQIDGGHFTQLKELYIGAELSLQRIIFLEGRVLEQLTDLTIEACNELKDLSGLWQLPNLKALKIMTCDGIVEVLPPQQGGDGDQSHGISYHHYPLPKVLRIHLSEMRSLVRISSRPLFLRSLIKLETFNCPSLKELSIKPSNSQQVEIECYQDWWEGLRWENGTPPPNFIPHFRPSIFLHLT